MENDIRERQHRMITLLLINLLIAAVAPNFYHLPSSLWTETVLSFMAGAIVLVLIDRRYGRFLWFTTIFAAYFSWQVILSNLSVAWLVLQPRPKIDPGIVAIPLEVRSGLAITTLASSITLTPGTITIDLDRKGQSKPILYVHSLVVHDPNKLRASIKRGFERMVLRISQEAQ